MHSRTFLNTRGEVSGSKTVKKKNSPHISLVILEGLKIHENLSNLIQNYEKPECFFREALQAHMKGDKLLGDRLGSPEAVWNNLLVSSKQLGEKIMGLKRTITTGLEAVQQQVKNLAAANKRSQVTFRVLHKMAVTKYQNCIARLAGSKIPADLQKLVETELKLREMYSSKVFMLELNRSLRAGRSFFGRTAELKLAEINFLEKKNLVFQIQKTIQKTANDLDLLQKKLVAITVLCTSMESKKVAAGHVFQKFVVALLKHRRAVVLKNLGIPEKDLAGIRASLVVVVVQEPLAPLRPEEVTVQVVACPASRNVRCGGGGDDDYVYDDAEDADDEYLFKAKYDSDAPDSEPEGHLYYNVGIEAEEGPRFVARQTRSRTLKNNTNHNNNMLTFTSEEEEESGNDFVVQASGGVSDLFFEEQDDDTQIEYGDKGHLKAIKRPRLEPLPDPSPSRIIDETFRTLLTSVAETLPTYEIDNELTGGGGLDSIWDEAKSKLLNHEIDKAHAKLLQSYAREYPDLSDSMRSQFSEVFSTANDIQQYQRRRRLKTRRRVEKKRKREAEAKAELEAEYVPQAGPTGIKLLVDAAEDDDEGEYDSDFSSSSSSSSSSDDDDADADEMMGFWDIDPAVRSMRMVSVLCDSDDEKSELVLPGSIAAYAKKHRKVAPFKKKKPFLDCEAGDPNAGIVLHRDLDTVGSLLAPPMLAYSGLVFGRFCNVCCRVVNWPDMDCMCTDYRGLKRSQCLDGNCYPTLRMRNGGIILRLNKRRVRSDLHKTKWRKWRTSQRDLLLYGHPKLRVCQKFANDPRVGNHIRCFMRFVFANCATMGTNYCVVCGDVLDVNRAFNFCNTCKSWEPFREIWKDVQKEVRPTTLAKIKERGRLAHRHNRSLKKQAHQRKHRFNIDAAATTPPPPLPLTTTILGSSLDKMSPAPMLVTEKFRRLMRNGAGKQPSPAPPKLAYKTPRACHLQLNLFEDDEEESEDDDDDGIEFAVPSLYSSSSSSTTTTTTSRRHPDLPALEDPTDVVSFIFPSLELDVIPSFKQEAEEEKEEKPEIYNSFDLSSSPSPPSSPVAFQVDIDFEDDAMIMDFSG